KIPSGQTASRAGPGKTGLHRRLDAIHDQRQVRLEETGRGAIQSADRTLAGEVHADVARPRQPAIAETFSSGRSAACPRKRASKQAYVWQTGGSPDRFLSHSEGLPPSSRADKTACRIRRGIDRKKAFWMRILCTNDDGIHAPGLKIVEEIARALSDDVWVVAPELDQSGVSHSLSLNDP